MNRIVVIVLVLLAGGAALVVARSRTEQGRASSLDNDPWRRTANGWERNTNWFITPEHDSPAPHPAVVAAFEVLLSVFALLFWPAKTRATASDKRAVAAPASPNRYAACRPRATAVD